MLEKTRKKSVKTSIVKNIRQIGIFHVLRVNVFLIVVIFFVQLIKYLIVVKRKDCGLERF